MMDPFKAWEQLAKAVSASRWDRATEIAQNLTEWLSNGGLPPRITGLQHFDRIVVNATCQAISTWELA